MLTAQDLELKGCRIFNSNEVEKTHSLISAVMQPHQLEPIGTARNHQAHMDFADFGGLGLGTIKFGKMRVSAGRIEGYHLIILCRRGTGILQTSGGEILLDETRGVCLPPGAPLRAEFSEDCEQFIVRIGAGLFRRHTGIDNPALRSEIDLTRPELQPWVRLLWAMAGSEDLTRQYPKLSTEYQRLFLGMLVQAGGLVAPSGRTSIAPASVKRAEAFILENAARAICLDEIARAAEVPTRTLLSSFRSFRHTSPMSYLRDVRLDRVRDRLLEDHSICSVTSVALEEGFSHLGRFSQEYAARFGEKPSETLRLARRC